MPEVVEGDEIGMHPPIPRPPIDRTSIAFATGMLGSAWTTFAVLALRSGEIGWPILFGLLWLVATTAGTAAHAFVVAVRRRVVATSRTRALVAAFAFGVLTSGGIVALGLTILRLAPSVYGGGGLLAALFALPLLVGGVVSQCGRALLERVGWIEVGDERRSCASCGYDQRGSPSGICPECGRPAG